MTMKGHWASINKALGVCLEALCFFRFLDVGRQLKSFLWVGFFCISWLSALEVKTDLNSFVDRALLADPRISELDYSLEEKRIKINALKADAILPRFEGSIAFGPAPGLKKAEGPNGDTIDVWDFSKIGPYFGTEFKVAQPLNFGQLLTGLTTARADLAQKRWEIQHKKVQKAVEYQQMYYGYLLGQEMHRLASDAKRQLTKAEERLEEALDDEVEGVSQNDLLMIRAGSFEVDKGLAEAERGMAKAWSGMRFALGLKPLDTLTLADSLLLERPASIPPLDTLKYWLRTVSPELKRLASGIKAKDGLVRLEEAKFGPEFFLFGSFKYAKSWAGDRQDLSQDAFLRDPVNTLTGSIGIGLRYKLNIWSTSEKVRKTRTDLRQLKMLEAYAAQGLELMLEDQYGEYLESKAKLESARKSMRATEALLKGAAMNYDVDPSKSDPLISAYKRNLTMQKDYYFSVYAYNLAVAKLIAQVGWTLDEYLGYLNQNPPAQE